jgi:uncharacterized protein (TIGR00645 family)
MKKLEVLFEKFLFGSRWMLAPFYLGLVVAAGLLLIKFSKEIFRLSAEIMTIEKAELIISVLTLIDISLVANLLFIITYSGYESFVSKMDVDAHEDKPGWMGKVGFGQLKIKLIGSIIAISAIELLKVLMENQFHVDGATDGVQWKIALHVTFVLTGLGFALMDKWADSH